MTTATHDGAHVIVSGRGVPRGEAVLALAARAEAGGDGPALRAWLVIWQRLAADHRSSHRY